MWGKKRVNRVEGTNPLKVLKRRSPNLFREKRGRLVFLIEEKKKKG